MDVFDTAGWIALLIAFLLLILTGAGAGALVDDFDAACAPLGGGRTVLRILRGTPWNYRVERLAHLSFKYNKNHKY